MKHFIADTASERVDSFLTRMFGDYSRATIQRLLREQKVSIAGMIMKASQQVKVGEKIEVDDSSLTVTPADIHIPLVYQDENVVVLNKPAGVLVHSKGTASDEGTVASFIADKIEPQLRQSNRGGIVHRLDRDTSGVMITAKNETTQKFLQKQFSSRKVKKTYMAVVTGVPKEAEAIIKWPIGRNPKKPQTFRVDAKGKTAETYYKVLASGNGRSLLELRPTTGRTHQLRVHLTHLGHPIVGDRFYGKPSDRLYLHAASLEITLPGGKRRVFVVSVPDSFREQVDE